MKAKALSILIVLLLVAATLALPKNAQAQAYSTRFTTSITYQNVGTGNATIQILFYAQPNTTTPITISRPSLGPGESASIFVGNLNEIADGFRGSAVIQSDQPLLATLVQVPQGSTTVFVRPLSNGFSAGGSTALIATVLKNMYGAHTIFSIQNVDSEPNNVSIRFYNTSAQLVHTIDQTIQPGASFYVDAATVSQLGTSFNGSVVAIAKRTDNTDGKIVGTAMELDITGVGAKAFESVATGAKKLYMPSALCDVYGGQRTSYAVQNTSLTASTTVTVTFYPGGLTATKPIGPGAKASFSACDTVSAGFVGSAVVESSTTDVVAIGKAFGAGLSTAFLGESQGYAKLALPYVRWAPDSYYLNGSRQRTYIAIQNVGDTTIPAGSITITYKDPFGHEGTHTYNQPLAPGAKFNSNASMAGLSWFGMAEPPASGFGGGAIINCTAANCQLIAVARVATYVPATSSTAAEDYNGMPVP
ncbi:MAG: hypothetical protein H5T61_11120 [Thermoflexales bacterium]|nr:hypothetical protein [Thermoflexales bacterium]